MTVLFLAVMVGAVYAGGPTDPVRALVITAPFLLLTLLVVRALLLTAVMVPLLLAVFFGEPPSNEFHAANAQWIFWAADSVLWVPASIGGYLIRWRRDR